MFSTNNENAPIAILKGRTQKGKNRVREQGEQWKIVGNAIRVIFSSEPGPWFLLISRSNPEHGSW